MVDEIRKIVTDCQFSNPYEVDKKCFGKKSCRECIEEEIEKLIAEHDKQVRADTIDECIQSIKDNWIMHEIGVINEVVNKLEQLKEKN